MRTIETTVYAFNELSDEAKQKAIDANRDWNTDHNWWECTYDDAALIGLKLTHFDLGRSQTIGAELFCGQSVGEVSASIIREHGPKCDTYKTAQAYYQRKNDGDPMNQDEFLHMLGQDYLSLLQSEYEYLTGDEAVGESLANNETEFTEDGKLI